MNLTNHFLIAMPGLTDPYFYHTVTYICVHNEKGAMGIVINRPLDIALSEILKQAGITATDKNIVNTPVFNGGPVQPERGFVLHQYDQKLETSFVVDEQIMLTTSPNILAAIANGKGPENRLIALGCAQWSPGQLEREMQENTWLSGPAETQIMFNVPIEYRWNSAAHLLGVDLNQLSSEIGHA